MPQLIVGHVADSQARIWVRGSIKTPFAFVECSNNENGSTLKEVIELEAKHDFTGVVEFTDLSASTEHTVLVSFGKSEQTEPEQQTSPKFNTGKFKTAPDNSQPEPVSFVLGSCNLHSLGVISNPDASYERINNIVSDDNADFMIHCGDQIYYDIPIPSKLPNIDEYRDKYKDAWGDCVPAAKLMTQCPHYMILDDHEIRNNFHNDMKVNHGSLQYLKDISLKAYREYQHIHNPQSYGNQALYYSFERAHCRFFVLDTRTERYLKEPDNQMIGHKQMALFKSWLEDAQSHQINFVVTSVPFVGQVKNGKDKWCGKSFNAQRNEIIDAIVNSGVRRICFLTGDMHTSYYASMKVNQDQEDAFVIHEIMSSPINQIGKSNISHYNLTHESETSSGNIYQVNLDEKDFYEDHSNVALVNVSESSILLEIFRTKKNRPAEKEIPFDI